MQKILSPLITLLIFGCGARTSESGLSSWSEENVIYRLGSHRGRLLEKVDQYEKAINVLQKEYEKIENDFLTMTPQEVYAIHKIEQVLREQMKITDITPLQDTVGKINQIKLNLNRSVNAIRMIESLEPIFQDYISSVEKFNTLHAQFFAFFTEIGQIIPFVSLYIRLLDVALQEMIQMQVTVANSALFEAVANKAVANQPIKVLEKRLGFFEKKNVYDVYYEYWSNTNQGRRLLEEITGEPPPMITWTCTLCSRDKANIEQGQIEEFEDYLSKHAKRIYIAIDELRIAHGGEAFPLFYGPRDWKTEAGGSRLWRKPKIKKNIEAQIAKLRQLQMFAKQTAASLDRIALGIKDVSR